MQCYFLLLMKEYHANNDLSTNYNFANAQILKLFSWIIYRTNRCFLYRYMRLYASNITQCTGIHVFLAWSLFRSFFRVFLGDFLCEWGRGCARIGQRRGLSLRPNFPQKAHSGWTSTHCAKNKKNAHGGAERLGGERERVLSPYTVRATPNLNKLNRQVEVNLTIGVYNLNLENFRVTCSNTENARIVANK